MNRLENKVAIVYDAGAAVSAIKAGYSRYSRKSVHSEHHVNN